MLFLLPKLIPLYITIFLGFLAGRRLGVERESVGALVFYILAPVIMLSGVMKADFTDGTSIISKWRQSVTCQATDGGL